MSASHYQPGEITTPPGVSLKDLAWSGFSWDLHLPKMAGRNEECFMQFVVLPGMLLVRRGTGVLDSWELLTSGIPDGVSLLTYQDGEEPMLRRAEIMTKRVRRGGYKWDMKPFMFTMNPKDYPGWAMEHYSMVEKRRFFVESLGDVIRFNGPQGTVDDVFNAALTARCGILRANGVLNPYDVGVSR